MKKVVIGFLLLALSACGSTSGWRVSFGVSPVTAIEEQQTLKTVPEAAEKKFVSQRR